MFLLNTILAWNINIIMNKKYDNNNIIIASRAYFLHKHQAQVLFCDRNINFIFIRTCNLNLGPINDSNWTTSIIGLGNIWTTEFGNIRRRCPTQNQKVNFLVKKCEPQ
jgi:hypothetical protein